MSHSSPQLIREITGFSLKTHSKDKVFRLIEKTIPLELVSFGQERRISGQLLDISPAVASSESHSFVNKQQILHPIPIFKKTILHPVKTISGKGKIIPEIDKTFTGIIFSFPEIISPFSFTN